MGRFIGKILITAAAALIAARLLSGVSIDSSWTAVMLALVLALLNGFIKPILVVLTIPVTILTLGLFLLLINIAIIKWAAVIVPGFHVQNNWAALWFSILLSIIVYFIEKLIGKPQDEKKEG
ncbi:MAG TPA: phage holin family protein [Chitinophagaceae bacterium]|nr:phage holin family protein [Chitinophagaceae bacterium]